MDVNHRAVRALIAVIVSFQATLNIFGQGQYLRGEKWKKFIAADTTADFYVSPNGNDNWSGKLPSPNELKNDGPFRTIEKAQQAVKELKSEIYTPEETPIEINYIGSPHSLGDGRDILVLIRGGYYSLAKPLIFEPEDCGERVETNMPSGAFEYHKLKDYFVTYAAYPGETPVISGGRKIESWYKDDKYWSAESGDIDIAGIIIDGESQTLARTPNTGYYVFSEPSTKKTEFSFNPGELKNWSGIEDNRVRMYLRWHHGINSISYIDEENSTAVLKSPQDGILVITPRYYVENVKSLLDFPGEWYYDKSQGKVSIIPPKHISDPNTSTIAAPILKNLVRIEGSREKPVRNLRLYGLTFEAAKGDGSLISIKYANRCEIADSEIRNTGGTGIHVGLGSFRIRILNNRFIQTGNSAVRADGDAYPESWNDLVRELIITDNYLEKCGGAAIGVRNALFTTISHNEITENLGRTAVYVGGWRNLEEAVDGGYRVEYNYIHNAQSYADDSGVITTRGYTYDSIIRGNLIHGVKKGMFNDNVAIWFDNMSYGWKAENNIFFDLEQGEMKLCAANLVDNVYRNNHRIERPEIMPSGKIGGLPEFELQSVNILGSDKNRVADFNTGDFVKVIGEVKNMGSTGIETVNLYVNGQIVDSKNIALISGNETAVAFEYLLSESGDFRFWLNNSEEMTIHVIGDAVNFYYDSLKLSSDIIPEGSEIFVSANIRRVNADEKKTEASLIVNDQIISSKNVFFDDQDQKTVSFNFTPEAGEYKVRIGNSKISNLKVYPYELIKSNRTELEKYCTSRAEPCEFEIDSENHIYRIKTSGTDFFHGEDSYSVIYLKERIKGNFIATVKITGFGDRTHEWFRAGLFARNDMTRSYETGVGSKGSVLMFASPRRGGMNWDEFGDGCMHKADSENLPIIDNYPVWIKLERKGDKFSGYISYDGKDWFIVRHTEGLPGLNEAIHIGIAAGGPDQRVYSVEFADFEILAEKQLN